MLGRNGALWLAAAAGAALGARAAVRYSRSFDLRDKVVLITGSSRGLGLVLAREFGRHGARVALCARRFDELLPAIADLQQRGVVVAGFPADVTDRHQLAGLVSDVRERFGRIDVLVNNAGVVEVGPVSTMTVQDYEQALATHLWGPLVATLAVLPEMRARGQGRIVNICSIGGKVSMPHLLPYGVSKFALTGLSEGLRAELARDGVLVTTVIPGLMRTGSPEHAVFKGQHRKEYTWFSISDSLPVLSIDAGRAARKIVRACRYGQAELIFTPAARLATWFHGLFPGTTAELLSLVNRLLPAPGGIGNQRALGADSHSEAAPSWATALTERAARENNEGEVR
jgi:NAD(P)-dependent dehydrogenase (short-subunit alcohol dehydrogenase family)